MEANYQHRYISHFCISNLEPSQQRRKEIEIEFNSIFLPIRQIFETFSLFSNIGDGFYLFLDWNVDHQLFQLYMIVISLTEPLTSTWTVH